MNLLVWRISLLLSIIGGSSGLVKVHWGLPDSAAVIGKLFTYYIPDDAFTGEIDHYEVSEATGADELPGWLHWDKGNRNDHKTEPSTEDRYSSVQKLYGVPSVEDIGPHYIAVRAVGPLNSTHVSVAKDVFSIYVREEASSSGLKNLQTLEDKRFKEKDIRCPPEDPIITISIWLDIDLHLIRPSERKNILGSAAEVLNIPVERLRLYTSDYARSLKHDPLIAGPGEIGGQQISDKGCYLSWKIGCGQTISHHLDTTVSALEQKVISGQLSADLGYRILSWQVTSGKFGPRKRRRIANGYATATPVYQPTPASRTPDVEIRPIFTTISVKTSRTEVTPEPSKITPRIRVYKTTIRRRPVTTTTTTPVYPDEKPKLRNSMGTLRCNVGVICQHKIHKETFRDKEDGNTYRLKLKILPAAREELNCILSKNSRHLICFSLEAGTKGYRLIAKDKNNQIASDAFEVKTVKTESGPVSHKFTIQIDRSFQEFSSNVSEIWHFYRKIKEFFKDEKSNYVRILDITPGSTNIFWANTSFPTEVCPKREISKIGELLKGSEFISQMGERFPVLNSSLEFTGACKETPESIKPVYPTDGEGRTPYPGSVDDTSAPVSSEDNLFISTLLPVVIILLLLILAVLIAFVLWRRNHKLKASKEEAKNEFVSKGTPVIFPDDVDPVSGKEISAAAPMLVKEERPPLPLAPVVPETLSYQNGRSGSVGQRSQATEETEMKQRVPLISASQTTEHENPLYKPPPPIELSSTRSPRPKHSLPHQREPPPYVPP